MQMIQKNIHVCIGTTNDCHQLLDLVHRDPVTIRIIMIIGHILPNGNFIHSALHDISICNQNDILEN